jgi:L-ascorbate metabolism protein UlaG (beta-lactamase superfamily)
MKLSWHGTASILLESDGYRIAFDPFLTIPLHETTCRRKLHAIKYRTARSVLVTHGHFDHIMDIPRLYKDSDTLIYATSTPCKTLMKRSMEREQLRVIIPGANFKLGNFTIRVYQGRHCRFDVGIILKTLFKPDSFLHLKRLMELVKLNRIYAENGETLFYEIEADGKRIQLLGSMGLDLDTVYPTGADVLILPFQGTSNPARTVVPIINRLRPKRVYLDHYDNTFPPMSSHVDTVNFTARLLRCGIPAAALKREKVYEI